MSDVEHDHVLRRAVQTLRHLPDEDDAAIRRVVEAAAAQRVMPAADESAEVSDASRRDRRRWRIAALGGLVAAAAIVGFIVRGPVSRHAPNGTASTAPAGVSLRAAANATQDALPVAQQFVFRSATARRVSVVGDFNRWDPSAAPMTRPPQADLWSATIPITPGRHAYGFMVDDSVFTLDPDARVPRARDPDLGAEGSIVMVGRP